VWKLKAIRSIGTFVGKEFSDQIKFPCVLFKMTISKLAHSSGFFRVFFHSADAGSRIRGSKGAFNSVQQLPEPLLMGEVEGRVPIAV